MAMVTGRGLTSTPWWWGPQEKYQDLHVAAPEPEPRPERQVRAAEPGSPKRQSAPARPPLSPGALKLQERLRNVQHTFSSLRSNQPGTK
jgi:hypothetical protein